MLDFAHIEKYHENNRIEAKKALGGLPESVWETYSAFANALGGIILLGVEEYRDKTFHTVDLPDPEGMAEEFWKKLNDPKVASVNILSRGDIAVEESDGKRFIAITVPKAQRYDRPVYIGPDPYGGSYRRSGEGDYRCGRDEVEAMFRDASFRSQDRAVLAELDWDAYDPDAVAAYREALRKSQPGSSLEKLKDKDFLVRTGAAAKASGAGSGGGRICPTAAGLLMFGREEIRRRIFPGLELIYEEIRDAEQRSFRYEGKNLIDFYRFVSERTAERFACECVPSAEKDPADGTTVDGTSADGTTKERIRAAVLEAVSNSLVNADYYGSGLILVQIGADRIRVGNPGGFRISLTSALLGGTSDPRNLSIRRMFARIGVGGGAGLGISGIYRTWQELGFGRPVFSEGVGPERTMLTLPLSADPEDPAQKTDMIRRIQKNASAAVLKEQAISYLTDRISAPTREIAQALSVSRPRAGEILAALSAEGLVVREGENKAEVWKLKA